MQPEIEIVEQYSDPRDVKSRAQALAAVESSQKVKSTQAAKALPKVNLLNYRDPRTGKPNQC